MVFFYYQGKVTRKNGNCDIFFVPKTSLVDDLNRTNKNILKLGVYVDVFFYYSLRGCKMNICRCTKKFFLRK